MRNWLIVVVVCLLVAGGLASYKYRQIQAAIAFGQSFPEPMEAVEVFIVREELWQPSTNVTGEVVAVRSVQLSNELAGTIVEVGFAPGDTVAAGQVLVQLDTSEEWAQLSAARADADIARLDLSRNQKLIDRGAAAEEARDRAKASFDAASAMVQRLRALIEKKTLRAPFAARTGLHQLEVGQYLDKGTAITRLIGISDDVWVDFTLPQQQSGLEVGAVVAVSVAGEPGAQDAEIIARDAFVNELSRNVGFRAITSSGALGAAPGSLVTVEVPIGEPVIATMVPITSVRRNAFGAHVFALQPAEEGARAAERAERRVVELGPQRDEYVTILTGLRPGERIAANGAFKLREGVLVNVQEIDAGLAEGGSGSPVPGQ